MSPSIQQLLQNVNVKFLLNFLADINPRNKLNFQAQSCRVRHPLPYWSTQAADQWCMFVMQHFQPVWSPIANVLCDLLCIGYCVCSHKCNS